MTPEDAIDCTTWDQAESEGIEPEGFEDWFYEQLGDEYGERELTPEEKRTIDKGVLGFEEYWEEGQRQAQDMGNTYRELSRGHHYL